MPEFRLAAAPAGAGVHLGAWHPENRSGEIPPGSRFGLDRDTWAADTGRGMSRENVELVRRIYAAWLAGTSARGFMDADIEYVNPPDAVETHAAGPGEPRSD
jgi:hypothetical protein